MATFHPGDATRQEEKAKPSQPFSRNGFLPFLWLCSLVKHSLLCWGAGREGASLEGGFVTEFLQVCCGNLWGKCLGRLSWSCWFRDHPPVLRVLKLCMELDRAFAFCPFSFPHKSIALWCWAVEVAPPLCALVPTPHNIPRVHLLLCPLSRFFLHPQSALQAPAQQQSLFSALWLQMLLGIAALVLAGESIEEFSFWALYFEQATDKNN